MNWLGEIIQEHVMNDDAVLDLGCGIMQATHDMVCKSILGVDLWDKYLDKIKYLHPVCKINMDETNRFMDNSFDTVICLDVVEHLEKDLALKIIDECKRICRRKAIIYTPKEFKDNKESISDSWGMGENPHQEHKCVLNINDFINKGYFIIPDELGILAVYPKC